MPVETLKKIILLANAGATIIFQSFPKDVPGHSDLNNKRNLFESLLSGLKFIKQVGRTQEIKMGKGKIFVSNDIESALQNAGINREELTDVGLKFIRRDLNDGKYYYLVNHTAKAIDGFIPLNISAKSVAILDPQSTDYGMASIKNINVKTNVRVQLQSGESIILRCFTGNVALLPKWKYLEKYDNSQHSTFQQKRRVNIYLILVK